MVNGEKKAFSTALKKLETLSRNWVEQPPLAIEAAVTTVVNGVQVAALRVALDDVIFFLCSKLLRPSPLRDFLMPVPGRCWIDARNTGVSIGAAHGLTCVVKKLRGKDDVETRMVSWFGAGVLYSMVSGHEPAVVVVSGVIFALMGGGYFKLIKEKCEAAKK